MERLLQDKTTGQNVIWATGEKGINKITKLDICKIKPRAEKDAEEKINGKKSLKKKLKHQKKGRGKCIY